MVPSALVARHEKPTKLKRVDVLAVHADRIVAAIAKRGSIPHRELAMQRCYRSLDADKRELVMGELIRSGRVVVRDTRTHRSQLTAIAVDYSAGAQD